MIGGYLRLLGGNVRYNFYMSYYGALRNRSIFGACCRFWEWYKAKKYQVQEDDMHPFKFDVGTTVQVRSIQRIGLVTYRWIYGRRKMYEVQIGKGSYIFYEKDLVNTDLRMYGQVTIQELKPQTNKLNEGTWCVWTKPWSQPTYFPPYVGCYTRRH